MLGYADDHVVYTSFSPTNEVSALKELTELTMRIRDWMKSSFLKMNDSKTEVVIFEIIATSMQVGETSVDISSDLNYLGVLLDQNLKLKSHILTKTKRAAYHLYRIRQIAKFLDLPAKKILISSLVMSQLDYANAIFINLPNNSIECKEFRIKWLS